MRLLTESVVKKQKNLIEQTARTQGSVVESGVLLCIFSIYILRTVGDIPQLQS